MIKKVLLIILSFILFIPLAYSDYQENIDDEVKLYNFTRDVLLRLEKYENTDELKNRIQEKMLELSGKTKKELGKHYRIGEKEYSSFREYGIKFIYNHITYNINEYYISGEGKILENSFARVFVNMSDIYITEKGVFSGDWNMIEFFKTDENIEDYLNTQILEEKFHGKCHAIKSDQKGAIFTENQVYTIGAFGDYVGEFRDPSDCGKYGSYSGIRYFEKRGDYIIYINAGQDFNGLFFRFIEIK